MRGRIGMHSTILLGPALLNNCFLLHMASTVMSSKRVAEDPARAQIGHPAASYLSMLHSTCSHIYVQTVSHTVHEIGPANNTLVTCFAHALPLSGRRCARAKQLTTQPEGTEEPNKANPKPEARKTPRGPAGSKSKALGHQRGML